MINVSKINWIRNAQEKLIIRGSLNFECVCKAEGSIVNPDDDSECICDLENSYHSNDEKNECILCQGLGAFIDGDECACDEKLFTQLNDEKDGCVCAEGYQLGLPWILFGSKKTSRLLSKFSLGKFF